MPVPRPLGHGIDLALGVWDSRKGQGVGIIEIKGLTKERDAGAATRPKDNTGFELARGHAARDATKSAILKMMTSRKFASATHIAICRAGHLEGIVRLEDLLAADPGTTAGTIMDAAPPLVRNGMDQEVAAWKAVQHGETSLAVVDGQGMFLGFIPSIVLLRVLLLEHEEDLARLGGYLKSTAIARASALEMLAKRFWHRMPWLLVGLLGAFLSADIVGSFQGVLADRMLIAFFIPGIVYLADAVGTQTETVIVRGMSVGVGLRQVVLLEVMTGFLIGLVIAVAGFFLLYWKWGQLDAAFAIALSIFAACSTASATAMVLPWLLTRLGLDPAYGSGPMATVIQDVLSILIYFSIVSAIL
jgi:magnesium transporter